MKLITVLQLVNGVALAAGLSVVAVLATLQWVGRFAKGAAQTAWGTARMFASGFQHSPQRPADPSIDGSLLYAGAVLLMLFVSVFLPRVTNWLHVSAGAAATLLIWNLRPGNFGPWTAGLMTLWGIYYWAAAWSDQHT